METSSNDPLDYLKTLAKCAEEQRELAKKKNRALWIIIMVVAFSTASMFWRMQKEVPIQVVSWCEVDSATRKGELEKALTMSDELLAKNPQYFEGHYKKGEIQLMLGDKEGAKKSFQAAYDIFPILKYKQAVEAFQKPKVVKLGQPGQPAQTGATGQPTISSQPQSAATH